MYPQSSQSNIGTLLRLIQEDKNQSMAATPPSAEPGSPIRGVVQQPLQAPNDPNSARVVSLRPEGATQSGPQAEAMPNVVPPVAPVIAPQAPVAPVPSVSAPSQAPQASAPSASFRSTAPSTPSIGTRLTPMPLSSVLGASTSRPAGIIPSAPKTTPQRSNQAGAFGQISSALAGGGAAKKALNAADALSNLVSFLPKFGIGSGVSTAFLNPALKSGLYNSLQQMIGGNNKQKNFSTRT